MGPKWVGNRYNNKDGGRQAKRSKLQKVKKRKRNVEEWKKNKTANLRCEGKSYVSRARIIENDVPVVREKHREERKLGARCNSKACKKSTKRFCHEISDETRKEIFDHFWAVLSWKERKTYVASLVDCVQPVQRRKEAGGRRGATLHYHLKIDNQRKEVCREMFCGTFGVGEWSVRSWAKQGFHGMRSGGKGIGHSRAAEEKDPADGESSEATGNKVTGGNRFKNSKGGLKIEARQFATKFIESLPKMTSYFCRKDTSKLYLEPAIESKMHLYRLYVDKCSETGSKHLSRYTFCDILDEMNVSLFVPEIVSN